MPVRRDAHMPTHGLVILPSAAVSAAPATASTPSPMQPFFPNSPHAPVLPVNADRFAQHFTYDLARLSLDDASPLGSTLPVPFYSGGTQCVELPAVALALPHPPSVALLLFFGMDLPLPQASLPPSPDTPDAADGPSRRRSGTAGLSAHTSLFATFLLPSHVVAEFPATPAMVSALLWGNRAYPTAASSSSYSDALLDNEPNLNDAELRERAAFVGGLWANVLALGPRDGRIVDMVRCAWNVCREARRLRTMQLQRGFS